MYLVTPNSNRFNLSVRRLRRACRDLLVFLVAFCMAMAAPVRAETGGWDFERIMLKQYDYIFYCDMEVFDNFMKYPGSVIPGPYVRIVITYQLTNSMNRFAEQQNYPPVKYEELWYRAGKCVGLHRYTTLILNPQYQGGLYFRGKEDSTVAEHTLDAADCTVRLIMDIYVQRSIMAGVMIPAGCFESMGSDLGQFNFFKLEEASGGRGENMTLRLETYPRMGNMERYFYYDDTGRQGH